MQRDNAKQLMKMMNITYGEPKPEQLNFLNDINKKGTVQTGECTVPFYMKRG